MNVMLLGPDSDDTPQPPPTASMNVMPLGPDSDDTPQPPPIKQPPEVDLLHKLLPFEIRRDILRLACSTTRATSCCDEATCELARRRSELIDTTRLMRVSRSWRDAIVATAPLWTTIDLMDTRQFLEICLTRSQNADITVCFCALVARPRGDFTERIQMVLQHHARVSRIDICAYHRQVADALVWLLARPLPRLVSMRLDKALRIPLCLDAGNVPNLRGLNLSLSHLKIDPTTLHLSQLTSLKLLNGKHLQPNMLLDMLEGCQSLQYLFLRWTEPLGGTRAETDRVVNLPHIQRVDLIACQADVSDIVSHISLPRTALLMLDILPTQTVDFEIVLPRNVQNLPVLKDTRHLMVMSCLCSNNGLLIYADTVYSEYWESQWWWSKSEGFLPPHFMTPWHNPSTPMIYMDYRHVASLSIPDGQVVRHALDQLGNYFSSSLETLVYAEVRQKNNVDEATWVRVLAAFPSLAEIHLIVHGGSDICHFVDALATGTAFPCMHLRELYVQLDCCDRPGYAMLENLHAALRKRAEVGIRLKSLHLEIGLKKSLDPGSVFALAEDGSRISPDGWEELQTGIESLVDSLEFSLTIRTF